MRKVYQFEPKIKNVTNTSVNILFTLWRQFKTKLQANSFIQNLYTTRKSLKHL